jgi:hypothetical protein
LVENVCHGGVQSISIFSILFYVSAYAKNRILKKTISENSQEVGLTNQAASNHQGLD